MAAVTDDAPELDTGGSPAAAVQSPAEIERLMQEAQAITGYGKPGSGSPPVLDFKALLMPVSADQPAGGGVPFDVRDQLEQARKEVNPEAFAPDDPLRPDDFIKADWAGIIALDSGNAPRKVEEPAGRGAAPRSAGQEAWLRRPPRRAAPAPLARGDLLGPARSAVRRRRP